MSGQETSILLTRPGENLPTIQSEIPPWHGKPRFTTKPLTPLPFCLKRNDNAYIRYKLCRLRPSSILTAGTLSELVISTSSTSFKYWGWRGERGEEVHPRTSSRFSSLNDIPSPLSAFSLHHPPTERALCRWDGLCWGREKYDICWLHSLVSTQLEHVVLTFFMDVLSIRHQYLRCCLFAWVSHFSPSSNTNVSRSDISSSYYFLDLSYQPKLTRYIYFCLLKFVLVPSQWS